MKKLVTTALVAAVPAHAQTVTCSTSFQGYQTCQSPQGYRATTWERDGMAFGEDSEGNQWSASRWNGRETLTIKRKGK
jgi:hypothetical protein